MMIDWFISDILWIWGRKRAYVLVVVFLGKGIGYCNAYLEDLGDPLKNGGSIDFCAQPFSRESWTQNK